jgi:hypothetical protein
MMSNATPMPTTTTSPPMNPMPGGPMNPMYPMSVPGEAAVAAFLQTRHESLLHGSRDTTALAVSTPGVEPGTFNGFGPAYTATHVLTVRSAGHIASAPAVTQYFLSQPYVPLGKVGAGGRPYGVVTQTFGLPTLLRSGDAGLLDNLTYFHDASSRIAEGTEVTSYSVTARDARSLRLCMTSSITDVTVAGLADGLTAGSQTDCYAIASTGAAALESVAPRGSSEPLSLR